jgi:hypothetical protein
MQKIAGVKDWIPVKPKKTSFRKPLVCKISGERSLQSKWLKRKLRSQVVRRPNSKQLILVQIVTVTAMLNWGISSLTVAAKMGKGTLQLLS